MHKFNESLKTEERYAPMAESLLREIFPGLLSLVRNPPGRTQEQMRGEDYIVILESGKEYTVDVKADTYATGNIVLELWSNKEKRKLGWTLNPDYWADYILYMLPNANIAFFMDRYQLWWATKANLADWRKQYKVKEVRNPSYTTECLLIPYEEITNQLGITTKWELK